MSSPEKKRMKYNTKERVTQETINTPKIMERRLRSEVKSDQERVKELQTLRRKNFVIACEKVSCKAYLNRQKRLQILNLPACAQHEYNHSSKHEIEVREMPNYATESFNIEIKTGMWYDALEVCQCSISYDQYLSAEVMKEIIEIMMNAHDDSYTNYTIDELIDKCQQVLALNFSTHPPCAEALRTCYKNFLTTPMDLRDNTFTTRKEFGCNEGIVKYCMNRLESDIHADNDDPIVNKYENTPFEMKEGVQGLHWEKEKFEIYEQLHRSERIKRLMAVLDSVIELLQYDLAIWQSRHTRNLGNHIMNKTKRPLLATLMWPNNVLNTGDITKNCRQIVDLFIYVIDLRYPEEHIQIMTTWLNTLIEIVYVCETNSNSNYPNIGKYCNSFANKFYTTMTSKEKGLSNDSVVSILKRIQPSFMKYLIGMHITKSFLELKEKDDNIIRILTDFIKKHQWEEYPETTSDIEIKKELSPTTDDTYDMAVSLMVQCKLEEDSRSNEEYNNEFPKCLPREPSQEVVRQCHVVYVLYITLEAYLDTYSVSTVQDTLDDLNNKLLEPSTQTSSQDIMLKPGMYSVSEDYIKKYRTIYVTLQELLKTKEEEWPKVLDIFNDLPILG